MKQFFVLSILSAFLFVSCGRSSNDQPASAPIVLADSSGKSAITIPDSVCIISPRDVVVLDGSFKKTLTVDNYERVLQLEQALLKQTSARFKNVNDSLMTISGRDMQAFVNELKKFMVVSDFERIFPNINQFVQLAASRFINQNKK